jgi:cell division protein FtsB
MAAPGTKSRRRPGAGGIGRWLLIGAGAAGALWYAVQGGEYGTSDLLAQRSKLSALRHDTSVMHRTVDSLTRLKKAIETDPVVQERLAREEFGMVRGSKELLYRFIDPPDSIRR